MCQKWKHEKVLRFHKTCEDIGIVQPGDGKKKDGSWYKLLINNHLTEAAEILQADSRTCNK